MTMYKFLVSKLLLKQCLNETKEKEEKKNKVKMFSSLKSHCL